MPELPEVEVVKEGLKKVLQPGITIQNIEFRRKDLRSPLPLRLKSKIIGREILSIERRAKYILWDLAEVLIVSHLGMTGTWRVAKPNEKPAAHDHVIITLSNGKILFYNDPRRFGVFDIIPKASLGSDKRFKDLGPEPFSEQFAMEYFWQYSRKKQTSIKAFIMDQRFVVGVGNIYASEALFMSAINPQVAAGRLTREQVARLIESLQAVLKQSIESGGSSISDYKGVNDEAGSYQDNHLVYGREGEACPKCSHPIRSKVIAGRSTFWCVKCQKTSSQKSEKHVHHGNTRKNLSKTSGTQRSRRQHRKIKG